MSDKRDLTAAERAAMHGALMASTTPAREEAEALVVLRTLMQEVIKSERSRLMHGGEPNASLEAAYNGADAFIARHHLGEKP